jgi:hypothetical protein
MVDGMSDDRELLQLAAKAAGLFEEWPAPDYDIQWNGYGLWCSGMGRGELWCPHIDDGDALRLAVKLDLEVIPSGAWVGASNNELAALVQNGCGIDAVEEHAGDPYAATRRAILRVAAEIGKAMPA